MLHVSHSGLQSALLGFHIKVLLGCVNCVLRVEVAALCDHLEMLFLSHLQAVSESSNLRHGLHGRLLSVRAWVLVGNCVLFEVEVSHCRIMIVYFTITHSNLFLLCVL